MMDQPNIRTPYRRSAAETFRHSHRTRACVGRRFGRERDAWTDGRRVKRSSDPAEARAPLCGGWTEKKLTWILAISGHFLVVFKVQPPQSGARASGRVGGTFDPSPVRPRVSLAFEASSDARASAVQRRKVFAADLSCGVRIFG